LILAADHPEEIAGVLGHEIAHITEQHSVEQIISSLGVFAIVQAFFGDISGLAAVIIDGGARLLTMSFSREAESEADDIGLRYLQAAGIDPSGLLSFFEKLRKTEGISGGPALALLSTHPATEERIRDLHRKIKSLERRPYRRLDVDLAAVQQAIRSRQERGKTSDAGSR
jgi:predicted Zn-dependent protease